MKKYLIPALALGLVMTSCQSDEPFAPTEGGEKQVTFTLNVPGELGTRAGATDNESDKGGFSNGQGNLSYTLVLRADKDVQTLTKDAQGQQVTFTPTVVLGRNYTVTAYAYFGDTAKGSIDAIAESKGINDETKDAYTWTGNINFATDQDGTNQNITLTRPYAKLRLIATDYNEAKTDVKSVTVEYKNQMYTMFNAVEGQFNTEKSVSFTNQWNKNYYEAATTDGSKTIFADYVPVNEIGVAPFTVTVEYQNGETYTRKFVEDIPVKRNALTTLKGAFFTAGAQITVNVDDNFDNETLIEERVTVTNAAELTHAIATATDNSIIYFANDITGNATAVQRKGIDVIIDGRGFKYINGTITVDGQAGSTNPEKLTFQNINFYTDQVEDTDFTFISAPSKIEVNGVKHNNYTHNVTIQDCTFESANPYTTVEHGSASFTGTYNLVMKNCTAKNMHSLLQTQSCDNTVLVENVTTVSCKNGVSFGTTAFPTLRNSTINAAEYGVRGDGDGRNCNLKIENTTVNAKKPVIVRKMTNAALTYNVALNGADLQTAELYQVVFTKGQDDVAFVDPAGAFTISGAEDYNVYPTNVGSFKATSQAQLVNAIKAGATKVTLKAGNYKMTELGDLRGKTLTLVGTKDVVIDATDVDARNQFVTGTTLAFEGVTINLSRNIYMGFANPASLSYKDCAINGMQCLYGPVTFENCDLNSNGAEHCVWTYGSQQVNFTGCDFKYGDRCVNVYVDNGAGSVDVNFSNCEFSNTKADSVGAVEINSSAFPQGASVDFENCIAPANGHMVFISRWDPTVGATATVTVNGSVITAPVQQ
ncbi:MAG: hypothetical protein J6R48_05605 [Muribaculaceae bacterium]|nr:hypothetical protein [Muribaculaceae bacterium]